tara:strand:+ start:240 stop:566 length:327 start_codon:yes stop_codon:yes gene_type:complete
MKNLITILLLFVVANVTAQDLTLLHINAKWNTKNDYDLKGIDNVKIKKAFLEDQKASIKQGITSVPVVILLDGNGKPRGQWKADLSFKITIPKEEIQNRVNTVLFESK